jgi:hypothetical protein
VPTVIFLCTYKIQAGQDCVFQFWDGLAHYKAHYDLSWFRLLLRGNSPTSSDLILKMNRGYNRVSRELKKFTWWRGKWSRTPYLINFTFRRRFTWAVGPQSRVGRFVEVGWGFQRVFFSVLGKIPGEVASWRDFTWRLSLPTWGLMWTG